jgi:hypothetical protein
MTSEFLGCSGTLPSTTKQAAANAPTASHGEIRRGSMGAIVVRFGTSGSRSSVTDEIIAVAKTSVDRRGAISKYCRLGLRIVGDRLRSTAIRTGSGKRQYIAFLGSNGTRRTIWFGSQRTGHTFCLEPQQSNDSAVFRRCPRRCGAEFHHIRHEDQPYRSSSAGDRCKRKVVRFRCSRWPERSERRSLCSSVRRRCSWRCRADRLVSKFPVVAGRTRFN